MGHFYFINMDNKDSSSESGKLEQTQLDRIAPEFNSLELEKEKGNNFRSNIDTFTGGAIAVSIFAALGVITAFHLAGVEDTIDRLMEDKSIDTLEKVETASNIRKENYSNVYNILGPLIGAVAGYYFATKANESKK